MSNYVFRKKNHSLSAAIIGLVSSAVSAVGNITPGGMSIRATTKDHIYNVLYSPVYLQGKTLEQVKNAMPKTYKNNPSLFQRYYDELKAMREADMSIGKHPTQTFFTTKNIIACILVFCIIILLIILFKKQK
ncbi:MAG: hypothetical protein LBG80_19060 [Bacteroidales bacterium]|jgi:hypothetical protein|nr:hypothetical protein [Bacteroidales bacterium]